MFCLPISIKFKRCVSETVSFSSQFFALTNCATHITKCTLINVALERQEISSVFHTSLKKCEMVSVFT